MNARTLLAIFTTTACFGIAACNDQNDQNKTTSTGATHSSTGTTTPNSSANTPATSTPSTTTHTPSTPPPPTPTPAPADNTANNKRDAEPGMATPVDQSNDPADIKLTADIRRAILDDKTMSMNAQNCKIITLKGGAVVLRGAVDSAAERAAIEAIALRFADQRHIDNQLTVKTP